MGCSGRSLLRGLLAIALLGSSIAILTGAAETRADPSAQPDGIVAVAELFTSQGCSSCPPADAYLHSLAEQGDVLALSMHVNYWDYLGWKDTFATAETTARQRDYAKTRGDGAVYTPQIVLNGAVHLVGSKTLRQAVDDLALKVPVSLRRAGRKLIIDIPEAERAEGKPAAIVWLVAVEPASKVKIRHGENRGRKMTYVNVVRSLMAVASWDGSAQTVKLPLYDAGLQYRHAVLLQDGDGGPLLGAAWLSQPAS